LTILGTQDVDAGEYECVAANEAGTTTEIVELDVGCKSGNDFNTVLTFTCLYDNCCELTRHSVLQ